MMITDEQHLEADRWLTGQAGEHIHEWENKGRVTADSYWMWDCKNPSCTKKRAWTKCVYPQDPMKPPDAVDTPRSRDLRAMVNYAVEQCFIVKFRKNDACIFEKFIDPPTARASYKDHPSPQHAAAWAIYLALREVKS